MKRQALFILREGCGWLLTGAGVYLTFFDEVALYSVLLLLLGVFGIVLNFTRKVEKV